MCRYFTLLILAFTAPSQMFAYEDVLVPIAVPFSQPGGFGSEWQTELWISNAGPNGTLYIPCGICPIPGTGPGAVLPAYSTRLVDEGFTHAVGLLLHVWDVETREEQNPNVHFSLRLFERSEGLVRQGIEIPVVREKEFLTGPMELLNIPTDERSRVALRVYDVRAHIGRQIEVQIMPMQRDEVLARFVATFPANPAVDPVPNEIPMAPTTIELFDLASGFPAIASESAVRIRLTPITEGLEYWAFASITDRTTQYVSLVTPQ